MEKMKWDLQVSKLPESHWMNASEYRMLIAGDIQYDGAGGDCDISRVSRYVDFVVANDFEVVILGDSLNLGNSRERRVIGMSRAETPGSEIFKAVAGYAGKRFGELCDLLAPWKDPTRLVLRGHHYFTFPD